ncbi:hypothetical protein CsatA_029257 [Cannabis sativa]
MRPLLLQHLRPCCCWLHIQLGKLVFREEVQEVCKNGVFYANTLRNLKVLTMVIQETLRLYPPGVFITRHALHDIQFKDILVPKGVNIQIPISIMQQDTDLWGPDAQQFNPGRFEHGVLGA